MIKGEVFDTTPTATGTEDTVTFNVVIYALSAVSAEDQVYVIDGTITSYQFDAFTCEYCTEAGYVLTYSLLDDVSSSDAVSYYAWLTSFDPLTREIAFSSTDIT